VTDPPTGEALQEQTLGYFLDALGSGQPLPASGVAAALAGGMAAALVEKVARISEDWDESRAVAAQARALRTRLVALASADIEAYGAAMRAMRLPQSIPAEERDHLLGRALETAADVPLAIADAAADAAELAAVAVDRCKPAVRPDAVAAVELAESATRAAAQLVSANLAARPGDARTTVATEIVTRATATGTRVRAQV
jgi:formiminotetrahydrofolate cyclodeaminase